MNYLRALVGFSFFLALAYLLSSNKKAINWRLTGGGILLQLIIGILLIRVPVVTEGFSLLGKAFVKLILFTNAGTEFLFGELMNEESLDFIFCA